MELNSIKIEKITVSSNTVPTLLANIPSNAKEAMIVIESKAGTVADFALYISTVGNEPIIPDKALPMDVGGSFGITRAECEVLQAITFVAGQTVVFKVLYFA